MTTPKLPPPPRIAQKQVGVLVGGGADPLAAGEHDLRLEQVVDRQAALAGQVAEAAAEREAADAGGRDDPARGRQPVLVGRGVDFAPECSRRRPARSAPRGRPRSPSGPRGRGRRRRRTSPARRRCGRRRGPPAGSSWSRAKETTFATSSASAQVGDQRGTPVDHRVVDRAGLLVAGVLGAGQPSLESGHLAAGRLHQGVGGAHRFLLAGRHNSSRSSARALGVPCHDLI